MALSASLAKSSPRLRLADLIGILAHPIVLGCLGLATIVIKHVPQPDLQLFYLSFLALMTFAPAAIYLFVHYQGRILDILEVVDRQARLVPYFLMVIGSISALVVLSFIQAPMAIIAVTAVLLVNEIALGALNLYTKVSIHTATPALTALTLGYLVSPLWLWCLLITPIVGWARVARQRHTAKQVVLGSAVATVGTFLTLLLVNWLG